jgi:hypothetical protein
MDKDLDRKSREELTAEVKLLRAAIRDHRDSSLHNLCWHHPQLWGLLPEPTPDNIAVPTGRNFCAAIFTTAYRSTKNCPMRRASGSNSSTGKGGKDKSSS